MTKNPTPTEKSKKQRDNTKTPQNFHYTTITDRHRTVSWGNDSHPTGVVKSVYGIPAFPLSPCNQKDTHLKFCKYSFL